MNVGDKIRTWWAPDGARILGVNRYTGRYPDAFDCVVEVAAANTKRGSIEMAYHSRDFQLDKEPQP